MVLRAGILQAGLLNQSSAQVIDGSLRFDSSKNQHLQFTPGSSGNRKTWTFSCWIKRNGQGDGSTSTTAEVVFSSGFNTTPWGIIQLNSDNTIQNSVFAGSSAGLYTNALFRDTGSFFHLCSVFDTTATGNDKWRTYINGVEQTYSNSNYPSDNTDYQFSQSGKVHRIGYGEWYADFQMSQCYFVDGQALGPGYFGLTDPLTGTWRPKKFRAEGTTVNDGTDWSSTSNMGSASQAFNGDLSNGAVFTNTGSTLTTSPITINNTLEIYHNRTQTAGVDVTINGVTYNAPGSGSNGWHTVPITGPITTSGAITITDKGGSSSYLYAVRVDGVLMRDSTTQNLDYGTNGFYLPMDGNSPIGQDKSGNGNNWTPVNFGGSVELDKATGALPILNTTPGGVSASVGVRTDAYASSLVLALPLVGSANDVSNQINSGSTTKTIAVTGNAAASSNTSNFYGGSYYFDGTGDYLSTANNTDFDLSGGDFTIETWIYANNLGSANYTNIVGKQHYGGNTGWGMWIAGNASGNIGFFGNVSTQIVTAGGTFKTGQWNHVAITRTSNALRIFINGVLQAYNASVTFSDSAKQLYIGEASGTDTSWNAAYNLNGYLQDLRIYKGSVKYSTTSTTIGTQVFVPASTSPDILPDTPSGVSGGSKLTKPTEGAVTFDGSGDYLSVADNGDFTLSGDYTVECFFNMSATSGNHAIFGLGPFAGGNNTKVLFRYESSGNFNYYIGGDNLRSRPISKNSWYHLAVVRNSNVVKIFLNGTQVGADISHSATISGDVHVGSGNNGGSEYNTMTGFISNFRIIKDQALYTADFTPPTAPLTNITNTKLLCCQSNSSATVYEVSPGSITANGNSAPTTFNPFNSDINTVRGQETNYATLNPLDTTLGTNLKDGNLKTVGNSNWSTSHARGTLKMTSGKWFWEGTKSGGSGAIGQFGFSNSSASLTESYGSAPANSWTFYFGNGTEIIVPAANSSGYFSGSAMADGDTAGVALDMDNGTWQFFKNGVGGAVKTLVDTDSGSTVSITELYPYVGSYNSNFELNFGQKPFKFPPPDGYQPLNAANVRPSTVIARPDQYVGVTTYTGTGSVRSVNVGLKPDLIWIKNRTTSWHVINDSVRGPNKALYSNQTYGENQTASGPVLGSVSSFNDDGFSLAVDPDSNGNNGWNNSGNSIVAWCWKAGGNSNTFNVDDVGYASAAAAGLTGGDRTPTGASVGTKQGFSIIKFTGSGSGTPSIPHGLSEAPKFIIQKDTGATTSWRVFAYDGSTWKIGNLNNTDALVSATETAPTSSLFYANGNGNATNTQIAYLWHDVPGLQKFGTYTGNGSITDGTFVELGFKPRIIIFKNSGRGGGSQGWYIYDSERDEINVANKFLVADQGYQEQVTSNNVSLTSYKLDLLSNGFKFYNDGYALNFSGDTYIYAAWAEAPSFNLYGGQSNAR